MSMPIPSHPVPFRFPDDVEGWLTQTEGECLARVAHGRNVLEIGSFCGRSTICMAQTALRVTCIDPFDSRATSETGDTFERFNANLSRYGLLDRVQALKGTTQDAAARTRKAEREIAAADDNTIIAVPNIAMDRFGAAFIDGDHSRNAVLFDYNFVCQRLAPNGIVAFHDYYSGRDPGVDAAVTSIIADGAQVLERAGSVLVVRPARVGVPMVVPFLAIPTHNGDISVATHKAAVDLRRRYPLSSEMLGSFSALTGNFNSLYAAALNARETAGITHFVMLHADVGAVAPQGFGTWIDVMVEYMRHFKLGVISAACLIKDDSGDTSTAVDMRPAQPIRRLKMAEIGGMMLSDQWAMPLLINTGCMVIDITQPWADEVVFTVGDTRTKGADGKWHTEFDPEDWRFSRWLHERGVRYGVTTDVKCSHVGRKVYE